MTKGTVLFIGSNATRLEVRGGGFAETGQYLNETVVPAMALIAAGYEVVLATPDGTQPTLDAGSDNASHFGGDVAAWKEAQTFFAHDPSMTRVRTLAAVVAEGLEGYAGVFVPGGHAPIMDLMQDADAGRILRWFHARARPTALLCHGPVAVAAALTHAREFRGALLAGDPQKAAEWARDWIYAGYRMTVFSASEERKAEANVLHAELYFDMEDALRLAGGELVTGEVDFAQHVIEDRELITGQNPASDHLVAAALVAALDRAPAVA